MIKAILALQHGQIPPSLNFSAPNPQIDFATSPFRVNDQLSDWPAGPWPRRAAVSSFGLGGTNAHIILEQAPAAVTTDSTDRDHHLFVISAKTDEALERTGEDLARYLESHPTTEPSDVSYTLATGRRHHARRRTVVARDGASAARVLRTLEGRRSPDVITDRHTLFMFPGGGVQHVGMGERLYATEPEYRRWFDRCAELNASPLSDNLRRLVLGEAGAGELERPAYALPALFATEYAIARLLESFGLTPDLMIGHSLGEYTAACLAGVITLEDAVALVALRGELFESLPPGGMLSVPLSPAELEQQLGDDLSIAVVNKPDLCIVAGGLEAVTDLERRLSRPGRRDASPAHRRGCAFPSRRADPRAIR